MVHAKKLGTGVVGLVLLILFSGCAWGQSPAAREPWKPPTYMSQTPIIHGWSLVGLGYWQAANQQMRHLIAMRWAYDRKAYNGQPGWVVKVLGTAYPGPPLLPPSPNNHPYAAVATVAVVGRSIITEGIAPLPDSQWNALLHDAHYREESIAKLHRHSLWWTPAMVSWAIQRTVPPYSSPWPRQFSWGLVHAWPVHQTYPVIEGDAFVVVRFRLASGLPNQYWTMDATNGSVIARATGLHRPQALPRHWYQSSWLPWQALR